MKLLILIIICFMSSVYYSQQINVDKAFFLGKWKGGLLGQIITINFIDDSTSVFNLEDPDKNIPGGIKMRYSLDLSVSPFKLQFVSSKEENLLSSSILAEIEVIDQNSLRFIGEKVTYPDGKEEIPEPNEKIVILTRVIKPD